MGMARIALTYAPDHEASQRVATHCGLVREVVTRSHMTLKGGWQDTMLFSVLPRELR